MPSDDMPDTKLRAAEGAFQKRMMQNALFHRINSGVDPIDGLRFQQLGFFQDVKRPSLPTTVVKDLKLTKHHIQAGIPDGPLLFIREERNVAVLELAVLLLDQSRDTRAAALEYIARSAGSPKQWVSERTRSLLASTADRLLDDNTDWRTAAIEASSAIQDDLIAHCAGVEQSLAARYSEGLDKYIQHVIRPSFNELGYIRPPLWSLKEQRDEVASWITDLASLPTLHEALDEYMRRCGYVPLCGQIGGAALVQHWLDLDAARRVSWESIWTWALESEYPAAQYQAVSIALALPNVRPADFSPEFWRAMLTLLGANDGSDNDLSWRLICESAQHYAHHIEALYPGQDGERVACYSWWLAQKLGELACRSKKLSASAIEKVLRPEAKLSSHRWLISRSSVVPSYFRYCTLRINTVWTFSMFEELRRAGVPLAAEQLSSSQREQLVAAFRTTIIPALLTDHCDQPDSQFAFEAGCTNSTNETLVALVGSECGDLVQQTIALRDTLSDAEKLQSNLRDIMQLSDEQQFLLLLFATSAVYSTGKYDQIVGSWLEMTDSIVSAVQGLPVSQMSTVLELFVEFQQRNWRELPTRLPHILAYAVEQMEDPERVEAILPYIILLSVNVGIVSPLQRLVTSKWQGAAIECLQRWRDNMTDIARVSEPWIAARVRATAAAISRLIGPRRTQEGDAASDDADQTDRR
jgi:hypothetical protein